MFDGYCVLSDTHYPSEGVNFDARLGQRLRNNLSNRVTHPGNNLLPHLDHQHARFTRQRATLECIAGKVGHFRGKFHTAGTSTRDCEGERASRVLRWEIGRYMIQGCYHAFPKQIRMGDLAEWYCKL